MSDAFYSGWITCPAHVQIAVISNKGHSAVISKAIDQPDFQPRHAPSLAVEDGLDLLCQQTVKRLKHKAMCFSLHFLTAIQTHSWHEVTVSDQNTYANQPARCCS